MNIHIKDVKAEGARFFSGLRLGYEYLKPDAFYAGIDLLGTSSEVDFKATEKGEGVSWDKGDRGLGDLEGRFGYTFARVKWMATPFLGLGMYGVYTVDHHNHQGFKETLPYLTAGVRSTYLFNATFTCGVNAQILHTFSAEQEFKYKGGKVTTHHNMWGGEIGVPLAWHVGATKRWDIQLEPYFLKLDFSETQNMYGAKVLFGYRF